MLDAGQTNRPQQIMVVFGCAAVLLGVMWVANQGGVAPVMPMSCAAMLAVIVESLPVLIVYWLGALGAGALLRHVMLGGAVKCRVVVDAGLGLAAMLLAGWLVAWAGWLNIYTAWALPLAGAVGWCVHVLRRHLGEDQSASSPLHLSWMLPAVMPGLGLMLVAATCPPGTIWQTEAFGYDVMSYHLQVPREWLAGGAMAGLEHNVYSYLPGLFEAGYMHLSAMTGSVRGAIYTCQLMHVSTALLTATAIGCIVAHFRGRTAGIAVTGIILAVPWVMITGSLAYNEMAMLAFGAAALLVLFTEESTPARRAVVIGVLVGASTLCKLTAGPMIAVPVGVAMLLRPSPQRLRSAGIACAVGLLTISPYLVRNFAWTGNPVFPFAAQTLGTGHWNDELVERWDRGHGLSWSSESRFEALWRQWLLNTGYGAIGGRETPREVRNIARFSTEGGAPVLWLATLAGGALALRRREYRNVVAVMAVMLAMQLAFWLTATHLQSRFLLPTILPAGVVIGLGLCELERIIGEHMRWAAPLLGALIVMLLGLTSLSTLFQQTLPSDTPTGRGRLPVYAIVDSLAAFGTHPINELPTDTKTYLVADNARLLYIDRPIVYHSAFDASQLGELIRAADGDADGVNRGLRDMGVTHVWVHWSELDRLHATYGYDADVTPDALLQLTNTGWRIVEEYPPVATLYALPEADE